VIKYIIRQLSKVLLLFFFFLLLFLFFIFVVVGANREIPKLLPMGMADVGRYSVKMCFLLDL